jgi:polar amino acid transport system ATP-binding protein
MTTQQPILRVEGIHKTLGDQLVLDDVSLTVNRGEVKILIGPSGSGKSTLLQCLNFLHTPDQGRIWLDGREFKAAGRKDLCAFRQQVGMIFQDFNLFDHLTALDNVRIALIKVKGMAKAKATHRAKEELARVGLADKMALSGPTVRWSEAARFHGPGSGHGSQGAAPGRAHQRPGSRNSSARSWP